MPEKQQRWCRFRALTITSESYIIKREQGVRIKAGQPGAMSKWHHTFADGRCHFFMRLITRRMYLTAFGNATTKLAAATKKRMNTIMAFKSIKTHSHHFFVNYLIEGWIFRSGWPALYAPCSRCYYTMQTKDVQAKIATIALFSGVDNSLSQYINLVLREHLEKIKKTK